MFQRWRDKTWATIEARKLEKYLEDLKVHYPLVCRPQLFRDSLFEHIIPNSLVLRRRSEIPITHFLPKSKWVTQLISTFSGRKMAQYFYVQDAKIDIQTFLPNNSDLAHFSRWQTKWWFSYSSLNGRVIHFLESGPKLRPPVNAIHPVSEGGIPPTIKSVACSATFQVSFL